MEYESTSALPSPEARQIELLEKYIKSKTLEMHNPVQADDYSSGNTRMMLADLHASEKSDDTTAFMNTGEMGDRLAHAINASKIPRSEMTHTQRNPLASSKPPLSRHSQADSEYQVEDNSESEKFPNKDKYFQSAVQGSGSRS